LTLFAAKDIDKTSTVRITRMWALRLRDTLWTFQKINKSNKSKPGTHSKYDSEYLEFILKHCKTKRIKEIDENFLNLI